MEPSPTVPQEEPTLQPTPAGVPAQVPAEASPVVPAGVPSGPRHLFRALRHRNFRLFCFGQIISLCGTWMQSVAQSWLIYRLTHSEWTVGLASFCLQLPVFALSPIGGLVSDRYSRHRIIILTQTLSMFQALALAVLTLTGRVAVWHVLALATVLGIVNAFDMPGRQSFIVEMTSKDDLLNAISLNSSIFNAARVIGPAFAGLLLEHLGEGMCFLVNGLSFIAVIAGLVAMRLPRFDRVVAEEPWEHLQDGFRYAYRTLHIRYLLLILGASTLAGMPALILMPFFANDILHRGSQGYGVLLAAMGLGALAGTLALANRSTTRGLSNVVFSGAAGLGVSLILFAVSRNFYFSVAIMIFLGFSTLRHMASTNTLIQSLIPDDYRGRIMSMYTMTVVGLGPFGSLLAGAVAHRVGAPATVAAGGVLCLVASLVFRARIEEFRRSARAAIHR
jgi:MFS family permease